MNTERHTQRDVAGERSVPERPKAWLWVALTLSVVVGGFAAWQLLRSGTDPTSLSRAYGFDIGNFSAIADERSEPGPALKGPKLGGGSISLAEYRGKVVVINLWASWCGPCRKEQPALERVWREYQDRGVQFLGLDVRDQEVAAGAFREEFGVTYPSFYDDSARLTFELKAQVLPTTYVVDQGGRIVFRLTGTVNDVLLRKVLDGVLARGTAHG